MKRQTQVNQIVEKLNEENFQIIKSLKEEARDSQADNVKFMQQIKEL